MKEVKIGQKVILNKSEKRGWRVIVDSIIDKDYCLCYDQIDPSQKFKVEIKKLSI